MTLFSPSFINKTSYGCSYIGIYLQDLSQVQASVIILYKLEWYDCVFHGNTAGNVVRGNQNYSNEILTGASGHELQTVDRMSTNLLSPFTNFEERK